LRTANVIGGTVLRRSHRGGSIPQEATRPLSALTITPIMPARIEQFLTGKARAVWPTALVVRVDDEHGQRYLLQIPGSADVGLGDEFNEARRSLYALRDHIKAGGKLPG
jgi:hypothetical protein